MFQNIPIEKVDPNPDQPRDFFTALDELAESIRSEGLLEPIMVRPSSKAGDRFQIVHGERRYRASKLAGLAEIPAIVREVDDAAMFRLAVVENVVRSDLTPVEEAAAYRKLQDTHGMTQAEIGRSIGRGQSYIAHKLRLLTVPDVLTFYLSRGLLSENHFRQALRFKRIIGEDVSEVFRTVGRSEPRDLKATMIQLMVLRPYGRPDTALPYRPRSRAREVAEDGIIEAVNRFTDYVLKHNPSPVWERIAFWYLTAAVGHEWTVADITRKVSDYERLIYSQVHWYVLYMGHYETGCFDTQGWDDYDWAVYHDIKHAGLLDAAVATSDILRRASDHLALMGGGEVSYLIRPTEQQGYHPEPPGTEPDEKPASEKNLEELERGLTRAMDKITGACVQQAESISAVYDSDLWRERGCASFGEYVEEELELPAELVMHPPGEIRPTHEMARVLDEWSPNTALGRELAYWAVNDPDTLREFLAGREEDEDEYRIPESAVWDENGEPLAPPEVVRRLQATDVA
jgi:ParB family chromosome partitioning protein